GRGDGTFDPGTLHPSGNGPVATIRSDLNTDGLSDLVAVNEFGGTLAVYLGTTRGPFDGVRAYRAGDINTSERAVVALDLTADGIVDLVSADRFGPQLVLLRGHGDGSFESAESLAPVAAAAGLIVGRFDADSLDDILVLDTNL